MVHTIVWLEGLNGLPKYYTVLYMYFLMHFYVVAKNFSFSRFPEFNSQVHKGIWLTAVANLSLPSSGYKSKKKLPGNT